MAVDESGYEALLAQLREAYMRELPEKLDEMESLALQMIKGIAAPSQFFGYWSEEKYKYCKRTEGQRLLPVTMKFLKR